MVVDKLIQGQPYYYTDRAGNAKEVLYNKQLYLPDGTSVFNFRFRSGFINLSAAEVETKIKNKNG